MRFDRILGAISAIAGLTLLAEINNAMNQSVHDSEYLASLQYPYIAIDILLLIVGLYFLGRPNDDAKVEVTYQNLQSHSGIVTV